MEGLFASPAQVRLLRVLARDPSKWWTEREAGSAAGLAPSTGHLVFGRLHGTGVLEVRRAGRSHSVRLRPDLRLTATLRAMFQAEAATLEEMLAAAARETPTTVALYLFGSTARGDAAPESDLDLLVVGRDADAVDATAARVREAVRRIVPANVQVLALDRRRARQPRYRSLLANVRREGRQLGKASLENVLG